MLPVFTTSDQEMQQERYAAKQARRQRQPGAGQKGKLPTSSEKLVFIQSYWKVYPTYDVLGCQFGLARSNACTNVHALWSVLERTLKTLGVFPGRSFSSVEELHAACGEIRELLIDATEREQNRPQDDEKQRDTYSGKKNAIPSKIW
ncbi:hypothetical protein U14_01102 [Candidatus Moduliflexus flocculans]|uniref:Transposase Helix-turn-helix domain-containing protein n=1 Tax=Candidatus Moduliflexus flocculans TaxID=1499966 RepID=A0A0S6VXC5_9BACT|nr:hypothetical protein U14_01102 [Candidatus Moduliflexus flocculans]